MNLKQCEYFVCVADTGSFSLASDSLSVAQSALSRQISILEDELGQKLFYRHGRGVKLNEPGKRFYAHSRGILEQVSRAKQDMLQARGEAVGKFVIGLPYSVSRKFSPIFVSHFTRSFPRATLSIVEASSDHILEWLASGRLDIGLVFNPGEVSGVVTVNLVDDELCLITTRHEPLLVGKKLGRVPLRDLPRFPIIIPSSPHTLRKFVDAQLAFAGLELTVRLEMDSIATIVDLIRKREGVAIFPGFVATAYGIKGDLVAHPIVRPRLSMNLHMAIYKDRPLTIVAQRSATLIKSLIPRLISRNVQ